MPRRAASDGSPATAPFQPVPRQGRGPRTSAAVETSCEEIRGSILRRPYSVTGAFERRCACVPRQPLWVQPLGPAVPAVRLASRLQGSACACRPAGAWRGMRNEWCGARSPGLRAWEAPTRARVAWRRRVCTFLAHVGTGDAGRADPPFPFVRSGPPGGACCFLDGSCGTEMGGHLQCRRRRTRAHAPSNRGKAVRLSCASFIGRVCTLWHTFRSTKAQSIPPLDRFLKFSQILFR